ncbi:MAG: tryptophan synthase subunit alpha [Chloroflexi bacterium]|nr:tryptophan synthase subunit alpha [Chloroflexota bacterium]
MSRDRIQAAFVSAKERGRTAIVPFLTVGYPDVERSIAAARAVIEAGADVLELGVPFSDPLAEGPTIQRSSFHALSHGVTPRTCLDAAASLRKSGVKTPVILMGYYNPVLAYGLDRYCQDAGNAGVDGLIVVDLPTEEAGPLRDAARKCSIDLIPLLALTSPEQRIEAACRDAAGFVYCVSVLGVTGARAAMSARVKDLVNTVRKHTTLPVAVGFGISNAGHVREVGAYADGVAIGSALIDAMDAGPAEEAPARAGAFLRKLRQDQAKRG